MSFESDAFEPVRFAVLEPASRSGQDNARAHGYATGYAQGIRAAEVAARTQRARAELAAVEAENERAQDHARTIAALQGAAAALHSRTVPVLEAATGVLIESALLLAEAIIGRELSNDGAGAKAALDRAMGGIDVTTIRQIRMNPQDIAILGLATVPGTTISLVPDASLAPGDALTAFDGGFLDARIAAAFERASNALRGTTG